MIQALRRFCLLMLAAALVLCCTGCGYKPAQPVGQGGKPVDVPDEAGSLYRAFDRVFYDHKLPWAVDYVVPETDVVYKIHFRSKRDIKGSFSCPVLYSFTGPQSDSLSIFSEADPALDYRNPEERDAAVSLYAAAILTRNADFELDAARNAVNGLLDDLGDGLTSSRMFEQYKIIFADRGNGLTEFLIRPEN